MQLQIQIQKNMQRRTHETLHSQVLFSLAGQAKYAKLFHVNNTTNNMLIVLTLNRPGAGTTICFWKKL